MPDKKSLSGGGLLPEQTTPATPSAGFVVGPYAKSDHKLYILDSTGTETQVGAGSSSKAFAFFMG